jgi:hypothetical protein
VKTRLLRILGRLFGRNSKLEAVLRRTYRRMGQRAQEGRDTRVERWVKTLNVRRKGRHSQSFRRESFIVMWSDSLKDPRRLGIYAKGSCDLGSVLAAGVKMQNTVPGTAAVFMERGGGASVRSDILLQTLRDNPPDLVEELTRDLVLPPGYFEPNVFQDTFRLPGYGYLGEFPKNVVVLSMGPEIARSVYRHREGGVLVDPGGWWLNQDMGQVLGSLDKVTWFRETFEKLGRLTVEEFYASFSQVIRILKERTTPHVLVQNTIEVDPGDPTHTYQLVSSPGTKRRREFNLALVDMSRELDFAIVDVDRLMKNHGVETQVDFAHFTIEGFRPLSDEILRILKDREVLLG